MSGETRIRIADSWVSPSDIRRWNGSSWMPLSEGFAYVDKRWVRIWPHREPARLNTFDAVDTGIWHQYSASWTWGGTEAPEQGKHSTGINHRGLWFYGNRPWKNDLDTDGGRRITQIQVYLHRRPMHMDGWGSAGGVRPQIWLHGYNYRPGGRPGLFGGPFSAPAFARDEAKWVTLPLSWAKHFLSGGARGIAVYTSGSGRMGFQSRSSSSSTGRIRFTHE